MVGQTDLLRVRASDNMWADWPPPIDGRIMSQPVVTATVDTPVEQAVRELESRHVHRLVVVVAHGG